jgi:hypothetical protein
VVLLALAVAVGGLRIGEAPIRDAAISTDTCPTFSESSSTAVAPSAQPFEQLTGELTGDLADATGSYC